MTEARFAHVMMSTVIDTCAVWNVLASKQLHRACRVARFNFAITEYVRYESLHKRRGSRSDEDEILKGRLREAQSLGEFQTHSLTVEDLQEVAALEARSNVSKGELSGIAFAKRIPSLAFQTDDTGARRLASSILTAARVQTTPQLLGWLFFHTHLCDADFDGIVDEHELHKRPLRTPFTELYKEAMRCQLMQRVGSAEAPSALPVDRPEE